MVKQNRQRLKPLPFSAPLVLAVLAACRSGIRSPLYMAHNRLNADQLYLSDMLLENPVRNQSVDKFAIKTFSSKVAKCV